MADFPRSEGGGPNPFAGGGPPIGWSEDLDRVCLLPRRPPVVEGSVTARALVSLCMDRYSRGPRPDCVCHTIPPQRPCVTKFLPVQAWALHEMSTVGGLVASIPTGAGKTMISVLAPLAIPSCKTALLLIPANVLDQIKRDYRKYREHFRVPGIIVHDGSSRPMRAEPSDGCEAMLHVMAYPRLSSTSRSRWISDLQPDLIILDESDAIAALLSARTMRVARALMERPDTRVVAMTGSLTDKSIMEMWHPMIWALRERSPLPIVKMVAEEWATGVDAAPRLAPAGELRRLCAPDESARQGLHRRMSETEGVIMVGGETVITTPTGERVGIVLNQRDPGPLPDKIDQALKLVRDWKRPDTLGGGEYDIDIQDPMERARVAREVASGLFYKYVFPPHPSNLNHDEKVREQWYLCRKIFCSQVRERVQRGDEHMDSPKLLERAAMRGWGDLPDDPRLPSWQPDGWPDWRNIREKIKPKQAVVRLDSYLVDNAASWAKQGNGIVWYSTREFAYWLRERHGLPVFEGGMGELLVREVGDRSIAVSIDAHGRGRDGLQFFFSRQIIAQFPSSARRIQQLLARIHRRGQECVDIFTDIYTHTRELRQGYDQAIRRAQYVEGILGETHAILTAIRTGQYVNDEPTEE